MRRAPRSERAAACGSRHSSMPPRSRARRSSFTPRSPGRPFDRIATIRGKAAPFGACGVDFARLYSDLPRSGTTAEEILAIRRPMRAPEPARKDGPRINEETRAREAPAPIAGAIAAAQAAGPDLVEISPNAAPPIVKILDYGKYKYQEQKKAAEARKKQKVVEVKELKYRPMIDDHDYDVKMRAMERFFEEGDKVKITLRFRGREMAHQELGTRLLARVKEDTAKMAKVEMEPRFEGRQMITILAPR